MSHTTTANFTGHYVLTGGSPFNYNIQNVSPLAQCLLPSDITRIYKLFNII